MNDKLKELIIVNWQTTLAGLVAGTFTLLEVNGGAFNASLYDWVKAIAIVALGVYARSVTTEKEIKKD